MLLFFNNYTKDLIPTLNKGEFSFVTWCDRIAYHFDINLYTLL